MNRKIAALAILILFSLNIFSQTPGWLWAKKMGGLNDDIGWSVVSDQAGNVYTTGYFVGTADFDPDSTLVYSLTSNSGRSIFISKLDASGNFQWARNIGSSMGLGYGQGEGYSIASDANGNVYTTGYFSGSVDFDPGPGTFILVSHGTSTSQDIFISKLDSAGQFIWAMQFGDVGGNVGKSITLDGSGNIYTTGWFGGTIDFDPDTASNFNLISLHGDVFILKLDSAGDFKWAKGMRCSRSSSGRSIAVDNSGNVYTTGFFTDSIDFDPDSAFNFYLTSVPDTVEDAFVVKLDRFGNFNWAKRIGGLRRDHGYTIATDVFNAVYFAGNFESIVDFDPDSASTFYMTATTNESVFLAKLDSSGSFSWAKQIGGDECRSLAIDNSGNVFTTGYFSGTCDFDPNTGVHFLSSNGFYSDIFISKLSSNGDFIWAKSVGGIYLDESWYLTLTNSGQVIITGSFKSERIQFDSTLIRNTNLQNSTDIFIAKLDTAIITGIESTIKVNGIRVYPNPSKDQITIQSLQFSLESVELYNLLGEELFNKKFNKHKKEEKVDVSYLAKGMYILKVHTEKGTISLKLIKE